METSENSLDQRYDLFLKHIGLVFIACSLLGFVAMGPTITGSLLGQWLHFDVNQNLIHLILGVLALFIYRKGNILVQRYTAAVIGVLAIVATAYSIYRYNFPAPNAMVINIETPLESIFYLAVGLWALWVVLMPAGPVFIRDQKRLDR